MEGETKKITIEIKRLSDDEIRRIFANFNAALSGHFVLKHRGKKDEVAKIPGSGDHSATYVNKDILYIPPNANWWLCADIAHRFAGTPHVDVVVGLVAGTVNAAWLVKQFLYFLTGRDIGSVYVDEESGKKVFKRGFGEIVSGKNVLFVEDISTTGESLELGINAAKEAGGNVIGAALMCNRSGGKVTAETLGIPRLENQLELSSEELKKYLLEDCPLCKDSVDITPIPGHGDKFLKNQREIQDIISG